MSAAAGLRGWFAPLVLVIARGRRRPGRWLLPAVGIALAAAFAVGVAAEAQIAGDQSARSVLGAASPLDTQVRVVWQGPVTPGVAARARALLRGLGLGTPTETLLLNGVRVGGIVVRPAAITQPGRWVSGPWPARLGPCRLQRCPMLLVGGGPAPKVPSSLATLGVSIEVVGSSPLRSAVPLGFAPASGDSLPVLVTGDVAGLDALSGLSGVYRTHSWLAPIPVTGLRSWQLADAEGRLARAQASLLTGGGQFSLSAPFTTLDAARAQASAAPRRLLLAGGGVITALATTARVACRISLSSRSRLSRSALSSTLTVTLSKKASTWGRSFAIARHGGGEILAGDGGGSLRLGNADGAGQLLFLRRWQQARVGRAGVGGVVLLLLDAEDVGGALGAGQQVLAVVGVEEFAERLDAADDQHEIVLARRARTPHRRGRGARPARAAGP